MSERNWEKDWKWVSGLQNSWQQISAFTTYQFGTYWLRRVRELEEENRKLREVLEQAQAREVAILNLINKPRAGEDSCYCEKCEELSQKINYKCEYCGYEGIPAMMSCSCYDGWSQYCKPDNPGPGCPHGTPYCPICGDNFLGDVIKDIRQALSAGADRAYAKMKKLEVIAEAANTYMQNKNALIKYSEAGWINRKPEKEVILSARVLESEAKLEQAIAALDGGEKRGEAK